MTEEEKAARAAALQQIANGQSGAAPIDPDAAKAVQAGFNTAVNTPPDAQGNYEPSLKDKLLKYFSQR